ncbi:EAL domain-containing protein [Moraxella osloensis]|uniref:sensor domain-containing phosphodiesterase n=1 Tax=Faucicola osloensis TaxID=34062 RepID=UPI002005A350|nr:EAL domain-containing protein [Moraxella osloensis]MCK6157293.1 EAL domain-containing protein [Moraxella osloensis]
MSSNNDPVMPIDHRDCFMGANKLCHDQLSEYGFIVDSHFFDKKISLEHQNAVFASVFSKIHDGIFMLDERLRFICVNQQFLNITALPRDQVLGSPFYFYPYKTYAPHLQQAIAAIITRLDNRQSISTNLVLCYQNSPEVAVWLDICVCEVDDNRVVYVGLLTNLTKKDAQLSHTLHLYNYDELTGLPNYDTFYDKLKSCIDYYQAADNQRNCMGVLLRINIDTRQLISDKFIEFIEGTIQQYSWLAQLISFEITEVCKIHDELKAQVMLSKLRQYGFSISIDDFGTGFAAMQYLIKYPIDVLKIDRLFITDILQDSKKQVIVKSVIEMAHSLSMQALAEGVSNCEEIEYLRSLGCDSVQGFGFGKSMSSKDTTEWLKANYKPNYLL